MHNVFKCIALPRHVHIDCLFCTKCLKYKHQLHEDVFIWWEEKNYVSWYVFSSLVQVSHMFSQNIMGKTGWFSLPQQLTSSMTAHVSRFTSRMLSNSIKYKVFNFEMLAIKCEKLDKNEHQILFCSNNCMFMRTIDFI